MLTLTFFVDQSAASEKPKCPGEDSNLHGLPRYHLKVVRLPIPPPGLQERGEDDTDKLLKVERRSVGTYDY